MEKRVGELLAFLYGRKRSREVARRIDRLAAGFAGRLRAPSGAPARGGRFPLDERDALLITYGDQFREPGVHPLRTLKSFASRYLEGSLSGMHILPFFPYTSDDGFSISDYGQVNPDLGDWEDVEAISGSFRLMSDLVLNHCSASHPWFKAFCAGDARYAEYFIAVAEGSDTSMVARPRALPLLTRFEVEGKPRQIWTTFSEDQVDLNYANPRVLEEMLGVMLEHISHGVSVIRLDAVAYLWKELGTPCIHHPRTHAAVKLFRAMLDAYAPWVILITETNVPQPENLSYFGADDDEAHMVYQFSLPPLVLDAFLRGDAGHLREWAQTLPSLSGRKSFFNFLASHDGVGLLPAHGFLTDGELANMIAEVKERGGLVSYKATPDGEIPYELNVSYRDAVAEESLGTGARAQKFLASQAFLLSLAGVPAIYVHSLIGSGNDRAGFEATGRNRTINREKLDYAAVAQELDQGGTLRNLIYSGYRRMLLARRAPAFHPQAAQELLPAQGPLFAVTRGASEQGGDGAREGGAGRRVLSLINTGGGRALFDYHGATLPAEATDRITGRQVHLQALGTNGGRRVELAPWEVLWLDI